MKYLSCAFLASATVLVQAQDNVGCFLKKSSFSDQGSHLQSKNSYVYAEAAKPFPSLTQCYKNNQLACCVSAHDSYIETKYSEILSTTCLREYQALENYFCLGCYPEQGHYVVSADVNATGAAKYTLDADGKGTFTIAICKTFVESLYDPSESNGNYNYDNCGLIDPNTGEGYLPKERYANYSEFIEAIKPPYFENVKWLVVDDTESPHVDCFNAGLGNFQFGLAAAIFACLSYLFQ